jgi:hypothetical protein
MKQVKNRVYLTEGGLPIDPGRTTMGLSHRGESTHRSESYDYGIDIELPAQTAIKAVPNQPIHLEYIDTTAKRIPERAFWNEVRLEDSACFCTARF